MSLHVGYVRVTLPRASAGEYALQLPASNRWGFVLATASGDDSQEWPGGIGFAQEWEVVSRLDVPAEVRAAMDWLLEEASHNVCAGCGEVRPRAEMTANDVGQDFCRSCTELAEREDAVSRNDA